MNFSNQKLSGWRPWRWVRTFDNMSTNAVPFGRFPDTYLPANRFWMQGFSTHCDLRTPWNRWALDPYSSFLYGGGNSGTLLGVVSGLNAAADAMKDPASATWGIGHSGQPPTLGYCIGDLYKENVYFRILASRPISSVLNASMSIDVFQRSILKRIYIHHGMVNGFNKIANGIYDLTLDILGSIQENLLAENALAGCEIKITKKNTSVSTSQPTSAPSIINAKIVSIKGNWIFQVSIQGSVEPSAGDFYEFVKPICIEDPLKISGIWLGKEGEFITGTPISGYGAHLTEYSSPYEEVQCTGFYVWKGDSGNVASVSYTSELNDENNGEWYWYYYPNSTSAIYGQNPIRQKEVTDIRMPDASEDARAITGLVNFKTAQEEDITNVIALGDVDFVRIETNIGGNALHQNWHSPILAKEWVFQDGHYFKVINQPLGNVLDISIVDVTGSKIFNVNNTTKISIFNQYAWLISEHFGGLNNGIFGGKINSANYNDSEDITTIEIDAENPGYGTLGSGNMSFNPSYLNNVNSFFNRYTLNPVDELIGGNMIAFYEKIQNWKFINSKNVTFLINSISFSSMPTSFSDRYKVNIEISGNASGDINNIGYVTFDQPYKRYNNFSKTGLFNYEIAQGTDETGKYPTLCLDMDFISSPIEMNISKGIIVGVCGGRFWGMSAQGTGFVNSESGADFLVTTPYGLPCISSYCNLMNQEEDVFFVDPYTLKTTQRRGSLGFKEKPRKSEIVLGNREIENATLISNQITLDKTKDRTKSISFKNTTSGTLTSDYIMVCLRSNDNYYGSLVSGLGNVNLQVLRKNGMCPESLTAPQSGKYKFEKYYCSPVYSYNKKCNNIYCDYDTIEVGASTKDSPLILVGDKASELTEIKIEYIKDKQALQTTGGIGSHKLSDGETILIYEYDVPKFKIGDVECNSQSNKTIWTVQAGIFIVGTGSDSLQWQCPIVKTPSFEGSGNPSLEPTDFKNPLLVLPSSEYMDSIFNPLNQTITIFARGHCKALGFIGALRIPISTLINEVQKCVLFDPPESENKIMTDFLFRPLLVNDNIIINSSASYSDPEKIEGLPLSTSNKNADIYVRVIGEMTTNSNINSNETINVISTRLLNDGSIASLYDSEAGIRCFYSRSGINWRQSPIIITRDAHSPLFVTEDVIAYITPNGIEVRIWNGVSIYELMSLEGFSDTTIEEIQSRFYQQKSVVVGSGQINAQKMSGYKTFDGIYKIFFYTKDGVLSCMESKDRTKWYVSPNF